MRSPRADDISISYASLNPADAGQRDDRPRQSLSCVEPRGAIMMRSLRPNERRARGAHRGQALVEFAFVAPIFFLLLFAIIDFGRYVYYVQVLDNAAREGARYAIVHGAN